jgi:hypothetical protein
MIFSKFPTLEKIRKSLSCFQQAFQAAHNGWPSIIETFKLVS